MFELDIQSKNNDIQSNSDVAAYDAEAVTIGDHADYIIERASFNGISILTQNFAIDGSGSPTFNIGVSDDGDVVALKLGGNHNATKGILQASGSKTYAERSLEDLSEALANIAAGIAALKGRQSVAYAASANLAAAAIKVNSVDFAKETGFLTKNNILLKSALAMLSQANKANSSILVVLK